MSYRIQYVDGKAIQYSRAPKKRLGSNAVKCIAVLLAGFLALYVYNLRQKGLDLLQVQNARSAAKEFVANIKGGTSVGTAVEAFYDDIFQDSLISIY